MKKSKPTSKTHAKSPTIYTVTFNPAIDYIMHLSSEISIGKTNRSNYENIFYGGKGINVSMVLSQLKMNTTALGFLSGFTGKAIDEGLKSFGIKSDFVFLKEGFTRINVKIKGIEESEINGAGPKISEDEEKKLYEKLDKIKKDDILILSGSIPKSLSNDSYEKILSRLNNKGILFIVDAPNKDLLLNSLKYKPFLIKPNDFELEQIFNCQIQNDDQREKYGKELQKKGAKNVLITMGKDGALLIDEYGKKHRIGVAKGNVVNSVGAGDSMIAGFIAGYLKDKDYDNALKLGTACACATTFGEGLAVKKDIDEIFKRL